MKLNRQALGLFLSASSVLALAAAAEKPLPKELPPYGAERPIAKLDIRNEPFRMASRSGS